MFAVGIDPACCSDRWGRTYWAALVLVDLAHLAVAPEMGLRVGRQFSCACYGARLTKAKDCAGFAPTRGEHRGDGKVRAGLQAEV